MAKISKENAHSSLAPVRFACALVFPAYVVVESGVSLVLILTPIDA